MKREKLGKYCKLRNGYAFKSKDFVESGIPIVRIGEISDGSINLKTAARIEEKESYDKYLIDKGAILIAMSGATTGKIGRFLHQVKAYQNQRVGCFIPDERKLSKEYLYFYLKTIGNLILQKAYGGGQPNISPREIESIRIPIPEKYEDQIRIATLLCYVEEFIAKRKESIRLLDELLKSTFLEMFGDPVKNDKGWARERVYTIIKRIENGWSPKCSNNTRLSENEWAILKLSAVTYRQYNPDEHKVLLEGTNPREKNEVKKGNLLFSRKNTRDLVGACAYVFDTPTRLMLPDTIFRLVYEKDKISPTYLWMLFNQRNFAKKIQKLASGSAGSMPNISKTKLNRLKIPFPPFTLQTQFAQIVQKTEFLKSKYQTSLLELDNLYGSLSQRAFREELDLSKVPVHYELEVHDVVSSAHVTSTLKR